MSTKDDLVRLTSKSEDSRSSHQYSFYMFAEVGDKDILERPLMEYHAGNISEGHYVIRSCFGGVKSAFVASGSEVSLKALVTPPLHIPHLFQRCPLVGCNDRADYPPCNTSPWYLCHEIHDLRRGVLQAFRWLGFIFATMNIVGGDQKRQERIQSCVMLSTLTSLDWLHRTGGSISGIEILAKPWRG